MTRTIAVVTSSRSDFGFIRPILQEIRARPSLRLRLLVTGSHLDPAGGTESEITAAGFTVDARVPIGGASADMPGMAAAVGRCVSGFAELFRTERPDLLVVIADRYEMFGAGVAGAVAGLPVAHISGGDLTEGVIDDSLRHALTKLCHLHFPSNQLSADRILQMGEEPWRVHVVGEPSLDALAATKWLSDEALAERLGWSAAAWEAPFVVTLHPMTLLPDQAARQAANLIAALDGRTEPLVITAANHDAGGRVINAALKALAAARPRTAFVESLGWLAYASLMRRARAMIGNSSSGLLEAPSFELPVVNIGDRQRGRLRAANVVDADDEAGAIRAAIARAASPEFRAGLRGLKNPYSDGQSARKIVDALESVELGETLRVKRFQEQRAGAR